VQLDAQKRWLALIVLCFGDLMIVLDSTIVKVALPSIRSDLGFSEASLAWVVNAYLLTFGGFLLLGGRLGDLFGHRRLFLIGLSVFTLASLVCGLATSKGFLVGARAVQGLGGAVVSVVVLSLIMILFTEPAERAKAMGIVGFVLSGGGTAGVLLGGFSPTCSAGTGSSLSTFRSGSLSSWSAASSSRPIPASRRECGSTSPAPSA
jgi:MFS family permease